MPSVARTRGSAIGHGTHQGGGVGVLRLAEDLVGRSKLDELADIHHRDAVGDVAHHRKVVGDEEEGQFQARLQLEQQVQHLRLDRDVERRDRLVGHDEARVGGERPGDADALALAAAEGVREAMHEFGPQAHQAKQLGHPVGALAAVARCR